MVFRLGAQKCVNQEEMLLFPAHSFHLSPPPSFPSSSSPRSFLAKGNGNYRCYDLYTSTAPLQVHLSAGQGYQLEVPDGSKLGIMGQS